MVVLGVEITNIRELRGMGVRVSALTKTTLRETAEFWHDELMDSHFTPGNNSRYSLADRTPFYLQNIKLKFGKGQGRWVLLKLSEKSQRWMNVFVSYTGTSRGVTVRMKPPAYFGNPFIGSWIDRHGKRKQITRQPDKPGEVTQVSSSDRDKLRTFMANRLKAKVGAVMAAKSA